MRRRGTAVAHDQGMNRAGTFRQIRYALLTVVFLLLAQVGEAVAGTVRLVWDANTEASLAGYVLVYGKTSRVYTTSTTLPASATTHEFTLPDGTYYFAIRAFDTAGVQSGYSNELRVVLGTTSEPESEPSITSVSPISGPTAGGTLVTLSGTDFRSGIAVTIAGLSATVTSQTATSLVVRTPAAAAGEADIKVTNTDGGTMTMAAAYTYVAPITPISTPTVSGVSPASGPSTGGTDVVVTGTALHGGVVVTFGGAPATVLSQTSTSVTVRTPASIIGAVAVAVVNPDGGTATRARAFTYTTPPTPAPAPTVTSLSPAQGSVTGGTDVTINGTNFKPGVLVRFGGTTATIVSVTTTRVVARTPAQAEGVTSLTVLNTDGYGVQLPEAFTFRGLPPSISSLSPARGPSRGGTDITLYGAYFKAGASVTVDNVQTPVVSLNATRIVFRAPSHAPAVVNVSVTNPDGQTAVRTNVYTYVDGGPVVAQVLPAEGPMVGGNTVTILGSGFLNSSVSFGGTTAGVMARTADTITVRVPSRGAGVVDVVVSNNDGLATTSARAYTFQDPNAEFVRYFAEGASGSFFQTRFALANPHLEDVPVTVTFTDTRGTSTTMEMTVPAMSRTTIDESNRPVLGTEAFATKFQADRVIGVERTMTWAAGGAAYGSHSDTGVNEPRTSWLLAEGATIGGFNTFYLLQNPTTTAADVKVQYLLSTGQKIEKIHPVPPLSRTNIWVNKDDPALEAAEMSATITSLNGVPVVVERSMYRNNGNEVFSAGHNSAGIEAPAMRWFLAEGATGGTFDEFVLIANPNAAPATLRVSFLRAGHQPIVKGYTAAPQSRLTIWVDQVASELAAAEVSVIVECLTATPVVVERSMWWRATPGGEWIESHNNRAVTTTAARWLVADGESGGPGQASTYVLVANTGSSAAKVNFTLLSESGAVRTVQDTVSANGRYSMDVASTFPEARGTRFSLLVESTSALTPLVVERASYSSTPTTSWAAGTNSLAMPLP
jgi:hypothetical protein